MFFEVIRDAFSLIGFNFVFDGITALDLIPYFLQYFTCAAILFYILSMIKYWVGSVINGRWFR